MPVPIRGTVIDENLLLKRGSITGQYEVLRCLQQLVLKSQVSGMLTDPPPPKRRLHYLTAFR